MQGGSTEKILVGPPFSNNDVITSCDVIVTSIHPKYWWGQAPPAPPSTTSLFTVAIMVNESHSSNLNFMVHGIQNPLCGAFLTQGLGQWPGPRALRRLREGPSLTHGKFHYHLQEITADLSQSQLCLVLSVSYCVLLQALAKLGSF